MSDRFDGSIRLTADPKCTQCGGPIDVPVEERPGGGIIFAPSKCRACMTAAAPSIDLSIAAAGTFELQQPAHIGCTAAPPMPIIHAVSRCELCGKPKFSDGTEEHTALCIAFRELQERVERLEKGKLAQ